MIGKKLNIKPKIKLIAEIANTHQGDLKYLLILLKQLKKYKIEYVKFQIYTANELLVKSHKRFQHFLKQSFSYEDWDKIFSYAIKNFKVCADVFGEESLGYVLKKKIYGIKIHSSDIINKAILLKLTKYKKKIFLSTGGSNFREINYALKHFKDNKLILMHGYQNYPTEINDTSLDRIKKYQLIFKNKVLYGLQDHLSGDHEEAIIVPLMALSYNLEYLEKHVILKRHKNRVDNFSSLEPHELGQLKNKLLYYKKSLFDKNKFSSKELKYRKIIKKNWVAKKDINIGDQFSLKNIQMKRVNLRNFNPFYFEELKDKVCVKKVNKDQLITKRHFVNKIIALIIVRTDSKRLANKAMLKIRNKTCLETLIKRLQSSKCINKIIICTTKKKEDDQIVKIAKKNKIDFFRGSELNVLSRIIGAVEKYKGDIIIRVTGDDILIDPVYLDKTINFSIKRNLDYATNKGIPSGCEVEVFTKKCLYDLRKFSHDQDGTEYLTTYITDHPNEFSSGKLPISKKLKKNYRLTIDTKDDFKVVKKILTHFKNLDFSLKDLIKFCDKNKKLFLKINKIRQKKIPTLYSTRMNWTN
jgi:N,N'-diacetyllegionaminate synthase